MNAWADVDAWKARQPKPRLRGGLISLGAAGWYAFAKLSDGTARFRAHPGDPRIVLQVPCAYRPGGWRQHDVVRRHDRPRFSRKAHGPWRDHPRFLSDPLPPRTWEAVLVALDVWHERGCPRGHSPVIVELLP